MKLPFLSSQQPPNEMYWGILLKEKSGICYLFKNDQKKITLLKRVQFEYANGWDYVIDNLDEAMALIEKDYGSGINQCIFFIFSHLLDSNTKEISKVYLAKMREISNNLDIKPIGYMEIIDAVHEYIEHEHSIALSSLLIEIDVTLLTIFVFKGGHKMQVVFASRSDSLSNDIEEALEKNKGVMILPNKIYLYDSGDLSQETAGLLTHSWEKGLFPQQPRIESLSQARVDESLRFLLEKQLCSNVMFVDEGEKHKEVMGFMIGEDVSLDERDQKMKQTERNNKVFSFPHLPFSIPQVQFPKMLSPLFGLGIVVGMCSLGLFSLLFFFHTAQLHIKIPTTEKSIATEVQVSEKEEKNSIILDSSNKEYTFEEKKDTSGKRDIGEKALGEITLYSYDEKERTLARGTRLQTGNLFFELEEQTKIPQSQFSSDGITKNPGKIKAKVRAAEIGVEGNIEKNKRFSVQDVSSNILFGINEAVFSGGTKKSVKAVSRSDMEALRSQILLKAKNIEPTASNSASGSFYPVPEMAITQFVKEQFSAELGEETGSIVLNATVKVTSYSIRDDKLQAVLKNITEKDKPVGFTKHSSSIHIMKVKKNLNGTAQITIEEKIMYKKMLDLQELKLNVVGKSKTDASEYISKLGIRESTLFLSPPIPFLSSRLPFWVKQIKITTF